MTISFVIVLLGVEKGVEKSYYEEETEVMQTIEIPKNEFCNVWLRYHSKEKGLANYCCKCTGCNFWSNSFFNCFIKIWGGTMNPFLLVAIKLLIGFLALITIINVSGKGNLAPNSASDQVQNYVLGGIIGGVIYNNSIKIIKLIAILYIWCALVLGLK